MRHLLLCATIAGLWHTLLGCEASDPSQPAAIAASAAATPALQIAGKDGPVRVTTIASGLDHPWAVALLPDGDFLVTERPGRMRRISADGTFPPR